MSTTINFVVFADEDGDHHTRCDAGHVDKVVEVDRAVRFNRIVLDDPENIVASMGSAGDWDFDEFFCTECCQPVDAPDDFEIKDWY